MAAFARHQNLGEYTSFALGGGFNLIRPDNRDELISLLKSNSRGHKHVRILGRGTNILASSMGVSEDVMMLDHKSFCEFTQNNNSIYAGSGLGTTRFANLLAGLGLKGGEYLAGIPGLLGGALVMNAGTSAGSIGDITKSVHVLTQKGEAQTVSHAKCGFGYRRSNLRQYIILGAEFEMLPSDSEYEKMLIAASLKTRSQTQPLSAHTAGSVFKNPSDKKAWELIHDAGCENLSVGLARVSPVHANFIEAQKGAIPEDVLALIKSIQAKVMEKTKISLELEIELWGFNE